MNTLGSLPYGGKRLSLPRVEGFPRFGIAGPKPGQSQVGGEVSQCSVLGDASWHEELVSKDQAACEVTISLPLGPFKQGGWREGVKTGCLKGYLENNEAHLTLQLNNTKRSESRSVASDTL